MCRNESHNDRYYKPYDAIFIPKMFKLWMVLDIEMM